MPSFVVKMPGKKDSTASAAQKTAEKAERLNKRAAEDERAKEEEERRKNSRSSHLHALATCV